MLIIKLKSLLLWGHLHICPPWNLIPLVLSRLLKDKLSATVITLFWPSASWFKAREKRLCGESPATASYQPQEVTARFSRRVRSGIYRPGE